MKKSSRINRKKLYAKRALWVWPAVFSLLFPSCEKEVFDAFGRAKIHIFLSTATDGKSPNPLRSNELPQSETIFLPLENEDGLSLCATLREELPSPTRASQGFTKNARLRIAVYDADGEWVASALGKVSGNTFALEAGQTLEIPAGPGYTFVAYSFNNSIDPDDFLIDNVLTDVDPSNDLLYGKSDPVAITSGSNSVKISLTHKFSRVTLAVQTNIACPDARITDIDASLLPGYSANLQLIDQPERPAGQLDLGALSASSQHFTFEEKTLGTAKITSQPLTVYTHGANSTSVVIHSATIADTDVDGNRQLTDGYAAFSLTLKPGKNYALTISFTESSTNRWAGSNIFWDGHRLTFDPVGKTERSLYQGVFFKWGSLVGISPTEYLIALTLYVPSYNESSPALSTWKAEPLKLNYVSWGKIPALSSGDNTPLEAYLYNISDPTTYIESQGDICRYIGDTGAGPKGYRMPTSAEFGANGDWSQVGDFKTVSGTNGDWAEGSSAGTTAPPSYSYMHGAPTVEIQFPASGCRSTSGVLSSVGNLGRYWSGSPTNNQSSYGLNFGKGDVGIGGSNYVLSGFPIRCIKN